MLALSHLIRCATVCSACYQVGEPGGARMAVEHVRALGLTVAHAHADDDSRLLCAVDHQHCIIGFRGTADWADLITDARCAPARFRASQLHGDMLMVPAGFLEGWLRLRSKVWDLIWTRGRDRKVTFTGHSLGATWASYAAVDCGLLQPWVATFGCPRLGDADFAIEYRRHVGETTVRVVNHRDGIPGVPWFYDHGVPISLRLHPDGREAHPARGLVHDLVHAFDRIRSRLTDHPIEHYLARLKARQGQLLSLPGVAA